MANENGQLGFQPRCSPFVIFEHAGFHTHTSTVAVILSHGPRDEGHRGRLLCGPHGTEQEARTQGQAGLCESPGPSPSQVFKNWQSTHRSLSAYKCLCYSCCRFLFSTCRGNSSEIRGRRYHLLNNDLAMSFSGYGGLTCCAQGSPSLLTERDPPACARKRSHLWGHMHRAAATLGPQGRVC